ncbi:MAG: LysE family translocator [Chloroflexota bacterium]
MTLDFWIATLVVVATPGTGVLYTVAAGLSGGRRASALAAVACTLGIVPHVVAAISGLAALVHASALLFDALKFAGVAYLVYLAYGTLRASDPLLADRADAGTSPMAVLRTGVLINLLNPKLTLFFFAFLPQFIRTDADPLPQMLTMSGAFMAATLAVFVVYGFMAAGVRAQVLSRPRVLTWLRRAFAAAYVGLAVRLAVERR